MTRLTFSALFAVSLLFGLGSLTACTKKTEAPPTVVITTEASPAADTETEDAPPAPETETAEETPPEIETISVQELTPEAQQTLTLIYQGGPFPYDRDGIVFGNREKLLPIKTHGYYHEYTVPTPGVKTRGARRIVCGGENPPTPDFCYYTADHYQSFLLIIKEAPPANETDAEETPPTLPELSTPLQ